jgi:hypothetical protein
MLVTYHAGLKMTQIIETVNLIQSDVSVKQHTRMEFYNEYRGFIMNPFRTVTTGGGNTPKKSQGRGPNFSRGDPEMLELRNAAPNLNADLSTSQVGKVLIQPK